VIIPIPFVSFRVFVPVSLRGNLGEDEGAAKDEDGKTGFVEAKMGGV